MYQRALARSSRHRRIRRRVRGTAMRPRASVYRSLRGISVQLIDDEQGATLLAVYGRPKTGLNKTAQAQEVGKEVARRAKEKGITKIIFDRGGWAYRGRIQALAEAIREEGLLV